MSFILDALRKSESERQREAAPVLARAPLALVRRETPLWSFVAIGLLSLALLGVGAAWWLRQSTAGPPAAGSAQPIAGGIPADSGPSEPAGAATAPSSAAAAAGQGVAATGAYGADAGPSPDAASGAGIRPIDDLRRLHPELPAYRLSLLATDSAWIDGRRYAPGQRIGGGPEVVAVRTDGVVLAYDGQRFLLPLD